MPEPYGIETAGSFGVGNSYVIVTVGTTDFTIIGAVDNRVGVVFEATGAGTGDGTARRLNSQLGRIGGKLLADNLLRDGIDLAVKNTAYDDPVLYLKVDPEVKETVSAGSFVTGIRYRIRTIGTTNFLLIGSISNTVGAIFTATGPGTGTGTADRASDVIGDTDGADALDPTSNQGSGSAIGFNTDTPAYDLDINNDAKTTNAEATSQANISNIIINAAGYISTSVGPLYISPAGHDPVINFDRMTSDNLYFSDNVIGSFANTDIEFNPSGTGTIELESTTNITGDFNVSGSVIIDGNLTTPGSISFGDSTFTAPSTGDTLDFNTFISQDLNPGIDNEFNLGMPNNKWGDLWAPDWTNIGNLRPSRIRVSDQQILDGVDMEIRSLQSNDDLVLNPATGVLYVEELKFDSAILEYTLDNPNQLGASTNDIFGFSIDLHENICIIGAFGDASAGLSYEGTAYIYDIDTGTLLHTLTNPNTTSPNDDRFGYDVAIDGNFAVVSAPGDIERVYVYDVETAVLLYTITDPGGGGGTDFGFSISLGASHFSADRSMLVVGSYNRFGGVGRAYLFDIIPTTFGLMNTLSNPLYGGISWFGYSVSASYPHVIVGAPYDPTTGSTSGTAYIWNYTNMVFQRPLYNPNAYGTSTGDQFSHKVDIYDDRCVVSAPFEDDAGGSSAGKAYVFQVSTGTLLYTLDNPNLYSTSASDQFGWRPKITDRFVVIGMDREDDAGGTDSGKVCIYDVDTGTLLYVIDNPNSYGTSAGDRFGYRVAVYGDKFVIGAIQEDDAGGLSSGKAYVYGIGAQITNLNTSTPVQFASTGAGYLRFMGTNAVLIPAGDNSTRPSFPEVGDTRWNTDEQYLECFDGSVYVIATGGGDEVTEEIMEQLGNLYSLILG